MAKQYYRITDNWSVVMTPREENTYILNDSGQTVLFALSEINNLSVSKPLHPLPLGGTIAQAVVPANQYLFARAEQLDSLAVLVADEEKIDTQVVESDYVTKRELNELIVQIMKLEQRIRTGEIADVDNDIRHELFHREFLREADRHAGAEAMLMRYMMNMRMQLFAAENFIRLHKRKFAALVEQVNEIDTHGVTGERLDTLESNMLRTTTEVANIIARIERIDSQVSDVYGDYVSAINRAINPVREGVNSLSADMSSFNNGLINMAATNTAEEIEQAYEALRETSTPTMLAPLAALKDTLIDLSNNIAKTEAQDRELEKKIDSSDTLLIMSDGTLDKISE